MDFASMTTEDLAERPSALDRIIASEAFQRDLVELAAAHAYWRKTFQTPSPQLLASIWREAAIKSRGGELLSECMGATATPRAGKSLSGHLRVAAPVIALAILGTWVGTMLGLALWAAWKVLR